jgi:hypothetical protein
MITDGRYRFRRNGHYSGNPFWTFAAARDALLDAVRKLGATPGRTIISSNFGTDRTGFPIEGRRRPDDQGVAVYFQLDNKALVMAADRFTRAEENMRSLTLAIEAMRQLDNHGGGTMMERAFTGFLALPAGGPAWHVVLGVKPHATADEINAAYRTKARSAHPDTGGSHAAMAELNAARDEGLSKVRA